MYEHSQIVKIGPVRLARSELAELEHTLLDGLPPREDGIEISVGDGPRTVWARSVAELLERTLPTTTNDFTVDIRGWSTDHGIDASLRLRLYHNFADYQLSCNSEIFFLGKKAQLDAFFRRHRPWYAFLHNVLPFVAMLPLSAGILGVWRFATRGNPLAALASAAFAALSAIVVRLSLTQTMFPHVLVQLAEGRPRLSARELTPLVLEAALLAVTIVSVLVQILKS